MTTLNKSGSVFSQSLSAFICSNEGSLVDRAVAKAKPMAALLQRELKEFVYSEPCILRMDAQSPFFTGHVKDSVDVFTKKWAESEERRAAGRVLKSLRTPVLQDIIWKSLQDGLLAAAKAPSLPPLSASARGLDAAAILEPAVFGIGQGKESVSHEKHFLASARLLHQGQRTVVAAPITAVLDLMAEEDVLLESQAPRGASGSVCSEKAALKPTDALVRDFFATASSESLHALASEGQLFHGSAAKGDLIYAERVGRADCFGVRVPVLFQDCESGA